MAQNAINDSSMILTELRPKAPRYEHHIQSYHLKTHFKKNEKLSGSLKLLVNGKWRDAEVAIRNNVIIARVKSNGHEEKLDLELNLAIHGAVCFEHVNYMAEVDHELCFALEDVDNAEFTYFCARDLGT